MSKKLVELIESFGFSEMQTMIIMISMVFLLANFLGGFLNSIFLANGGPIRRRKPMDRMSVRLVLLSELFVFLWAAYYHAMVVATIQIEHVIYWIATLLVAPLLAFIGSQITYLIFRKKIDANYKAYARVLAKRKAKREAAKAAKGEGADVNGKPKPA